MQRSSPVPPKTPAPPAQVPDTQMLLQAALEASWQRDRRVGRRRVVLRWLSWGLWRCVPLVLAFGLAWAAWRWMMPSAHAQLSIPAQDQSATPYATVRSSPPASHGAPGSMASHQVPPLKPANRLHSKEP